MDGLRKFVVISTVSFFRNLNSNVAQKPRRFFATSLTSQKDLFPYSPLPFRSAEVDVSLLSQSATFNDCEFGNRLKFTIDELRGKGLNAIYLKVSLSHSHFIPIASKYGFKFHHAIGDYSHLLLWLPYDIPCRVPVFGTHNAGVGSLIIDKGDILVVKEKSKYVSWKLPGGYLNLGEEIGDGAVREVFEETGVKTEFESMLAIRHTSAGVQFGRGDFYIICKLKALSRLITVDAEIDDAMWMNFEEFVALNQHPMLKKVLANLVSKNTPFIEEIMPSPILSRGLFRLYSPPAK